MPRRASRADLHPAQDGKFLTWRVMRELFRSVARPREHPLVAGGGEVWKDGGARHAVTFFRSRVRYWPASGAGCPRGHEGVSGRFTSQQITDALSQARPVSREHAEADVAAPIGQLTSAGPVSARGAGRHSTSSEPDPRRCAGLPPARLSAPLVSRTPAPARLQAVLTEGCPPGSEERLSRDGVDRTRGRDRSQRPVRGPLLPPTIPGHHAVVPHRRTPVHPVHRSTHLPDRRPRLGRSRRTTRRRTRRHRPLLHHATVPPR